MRSVSREAMKYADSINAFCASCIVPLLPFTYTFHLITVRYTIKPRYFCMKRTGPSGRLLWYHAVFYLPLQYSLHEVFTFLIQEVRRFPGESTGKIGTRKDTVGRVVRLVCALCSAGVGAAGVCCIVWLHGELAH